MRIEDIEHENSKNYNHVETDVIEARVRKDNPWERFDIEEDDQLIDDLLRLEAEGIVDLLRGDRGNPYIARWIKKEEPPF